MTFNLHQTKRAARKEAWYGEGGEWNPFRETRSNTSTLDRPRPINTRLSLVNEPTSTNACTGSEGRASDPEHGSAIQSPLDKSGIFTRFHKEKPDDLKEDEPKNRQTTAGLSYSPPYEFLESAPDELQWDPFGSLSEQQMTRSTIDTSTVSKSRLMYIELLWHNSFRPFIFEELTIKIERLRWHKLLLPLLPRALAKFLPRFFPVLVAPCIISWKMARKRVS